ncbi:hypothetical protein AB395_00005166 (plasmid) [Sinorhizobium fredii CCBAU 45436]|nr:hypothetical protein AB395_00005166 [Sinorhizobium fredii CCBAU 45436]
MNKKTLPRHSTNTNGANQVRVMTSFPKRSINTSGALMVR